MESRTSFSQVALLALLVVGAITGVYVFFQNAPEAELYGKIEKYEKEAFEKSKKTK
ncbi:Endoglucanase A [Phytophthora nicotianae]|uniref:Endoglucanase A n=1 Tax=Phytophthora nicotianae TaxID=4792 RepID=A0A0W8CVR9_PHYNI|nr:Endoglucanase A [Phytophthora nicotianae]